jgi:hypothetical protein
MSEPWRPPVNPDVNDVADRAKYWYARARLSLAAMQYRIAELAGTSRLHPDESENLQRELIDIYWSLHFGTVDAVFNEDYLADEEEAHNTYSDGRPVMLQTRIEPLEESDFNWQHNPFLYDDDGAIIFHRRGTTCYVSPINPGDDWGWAGASF